MIPFETVDILGIKVHNCFLSELLDYLDTCIKQKRKTVVYGISLSSLGKVKQLPKLISFWEQADINIADGGGIKFFDNLFGCDLREHIGLPRMVDCLIELSERNHYKLMLLGGTPEVNWTANANIRRKFPNIVLCEGKDGYFTDDEEELIVHKINFENPDILLIGISSPKKEIFAYRWKDKLHCTLIVPCGGVIDILAEKTKREPRTLFNGLPLAWLFRFLQEPTRLFKPLFLPVIYFCFILLPQWLVTQYVYRKKFSLKNWVQKEEKCPL